MSKAILRLDQIVLTCVSFLLYHLPNDKLKKLLQNEDLNIDDLKSGIDELAKASQSFAEKLYTEAQNDTTNPSSDESDDVVEGEVIEDE